MRRVPAFTVGLLLLVSAACQHVSPRSGDVHQLVRVWPTEDFEGMGIIALLGDDTKLSQDAVVDLPDADTADIVVQFAIANAFRHDVRLKVSTRLDPSGSWSPAITRSEISAAEAAALVADRDSPYLLLFGTDRTGVRPPGFRSDGMTWRVENATLKIPKKSSLKFRRIFVFDFYIQQERKHYLVEYPFECIFRRG